MYLTGTGRSRARRRGLGCACVPKRLGEAAYTGLNPDGSVDVSWIPPENLPNAITSIDTLSNPNPFTLPGYYNNQPVLPSSPTSANNPNLYNVPGAAPGTVYNSSLKTAIPATGILGATGLGGLSSTTLMLGGAGLLLLVVMAAKRRR